MSNDLISRSALLEEINNFSMRITGSANAMAITIMEETKKSIVKLIDNQPTAYDVDKVVERLEECAIIELGITKEKFEMDRVEYSNYCALSLMETKEIVKSGGIE